jgi:hypothetical protein
MSNDSDRPLAWVESPLQLVAAAEWAESLGRSIVVAHRLTGPQMPTTAGELLERGARFAACIPYYGIPWQLLARHRHWAIGDAFSGQYRLAGSVLSPQRITLLDDGAGAVAVADALLDRIPYARPRQSEPRVSGLLGSVVRNRMLGLAARDRLGIATTFPLGASRIAALSGRGIPVTSHRFEWVRRTARPSAVPGNRVLLGSALPTDGRMPVADYLSWVASEARNGRLAYLPHRRETAAVLAAVSELPGVRIFDTGLPVELVLAGAREPLEVLTLPTSAQTTLTHLLAGSGSVIHSRESVAF